MILESFDDLTRVPGRIYGCSTGSKLAVLYNDSVWLLKVQQNLKQRNLNNVEISYGNDVISEYIGSHVYQYFGVPVHDTKLGTYGTKLAVLCSDKAYPEKLYEFREFRNTLMDEVITQHYSGMSTNIEDILQIIDIHPDLPKEDSLKRFWTMFVIDSLIGNTDRNNGNWGFVLKDGKFELYDVYDCGGCLNNKRSDEQLLSDLESGNIKNLALNYTLNLKVNGKRVNPFKYLKEHASVYISSALNLLDENAFNDIIDFIYQLVPNVITRVRFDWYKELLSLRFEELTSIRDSKCWLNNIEEYKKHRGLSDSEFDKEKERLFSLFGVTNLKELNDAIVSLLQ